MDNGCIVLHLPNAIAPNTPTIQPYYCSKIFSHIDPDSYQSSCKESYPYTVTTVVPRLTYALDGASPLQLCFRKPTSFPSSDRHG